MAAAQYLSPAMRWAVGGWSFFIAENAILSENRSFLIDSLGDSYVVTVPHTAVRACMTQCRLNVLP